MSNLHTPETSRSSTIELVIREASGEDRELVGELYKRSWQDLLEKLHFGKPSPELTGVSLALDATWLAERGGVAVGFLHLQDSQVSKLYVVPEEQSCGVGAALLAKAMEMGGRRLFVDEINYTARKFYERHGWHPTGEFHSGHIFPVRMLEYEFTS